MGIYSLKTLVNKYISEAFIPSKIQSEVCYIDFTYKICISTERIMTMYKLNPGLYDNPIQIIKEVISKDVDLLYNQLQMNKFFKKFVIAFDYKVEGDSSANIMHFNETLVDKYFENASKWTKIKSSVLIPRSMITHINDPCYTNTILAASKLMVDLRYNRKLASSKVVIDKYISIDYLKDDMNPEIYKLLKYNGLTRYMLTRGCKEFTRLIRKQHQISWDETNDDNFDEIFKSTIMNVNRVQMVNLIPFIIHDLIEKIDDQYTVEFIGANSESDYSIIKHINMYHQNHCPTIYTNDSDFFTLLSDQDVIIKFPYQNEKTRDKYNVSIKPKDFWNWLLNDKTWNYYDIITISCLLGTDYNKDSPYHIRTIDKLRKFYRDNHVVDRKNPKILYDKIYDSTFDTLKFSTKNLSFLLAMEIYSQASLIENQVLYIEPKKFDMKVINDSFRSLFSDLILDSY